MGGREKPHKEIHFSGRTVSLPTCHQADATSDEEGGDDEVGIPFIFASLVHLIRHVALLLVDARGRNGKQHLFSLRD